MSKKIVILFGEMGAGKNYWGNFLMTFRNTTSKFFDGDKAIPPEMAKRVAKFQSLTREMIHAYVHDHLAPAIVEQAEASNAQVLYVAQALYFNTDRLFLRDYLTALGYQVSFARIKPPFWRNMLQLFSRKRGFMWVIYWLMSKPHFEEPDFKCFVFTA